MKTAAIVGLLLCVFATSPVHAQLQNESDAAKKSAGDKKESAGKTTGDAQQSDFVPGEKVLFYDDFAKDAKADFPAKWNTNGSGEIVLINGTEGKWLKVPDNTTSFPEINKTLPDNFTIEFDLYYPTGATRPPVTFGFTEVKNPAKENIKHKRIFYFRITPSTGDNIGYSTSLYSGRETTQPWPANMMAGKVIHVSMAINKQRIRLYVDDKKIFDLPKAFEPTVLRNNFHFRAAELLPKPQDGFYISNLRIAESGQDARSQLLKKGSFSTTGIYFNTGSAVIKPTSHNTLKMIADIIKENPGIRLKIIGHTDSDGASATNLSLSRKRAEAVKAYLDKSFDVDTKEIETDGKGASQPASDNNTEEGKAENRRVEFIKR